MGKNYTESLFFNCSVIARQCCVSLCCTMKRMSHVYTYTLPPTPNPPHHLDHRRAPEHRDTEPFKTRDSWPTADLMKARSLWSGRKMMPQPHVIYLIGTPAPASCETFGKVTWGSFQPPGVTWTAHAQGGRKLDVRWRCSGTFEVAAVAMETLLEGALETVCLPNSKDMLLS